MRCIGRFDSDSSPVITTGISRPETMPVSSRAVVPELPQSIVFDSAGCSSRGETLKVVALSCVTLQPRALTAFNEEAQSAPSEKLCIRNGSALNNAKSAARCEIDLSPGSLSEPPILRCGFSVFISMGAKSANLFVVTAVIYIVLPSIFATSAHSVFNFSSVSIGIV